MDVEVRAGQYFTVSLFHSGGGGGGVASPSIEASATGGRPGGYFKETFALTLSNTVPSQRVCLPGQQTQALTKNLEVDLGLRRLFSQI